MPEISIRMSASSSTIRMSCAMDDRPRLGFDALRRRLLDPAGEHETDARAAARRILEPELAAVILHDLLDDRQAEAGALGAGRDVGLGQAIAPLDRQPLAVVVDLDDGRALGVAQADHDLSPRQPLVTGLLPPFDGVEGVLH